jgi:isopentenyl-diphosphate Delta-isomerase
VPDAAEELVVLIDEQGRPNGQAPKRTVHAARTPRHLAFSCYGFDAGDRLLVTRRAATKVTFPGFWTNTCCGHPAPGESPADAASRRLRDELGLRAADVRVVLPDFSYRASAGGVEENELCPVLTCRLEGDPVPNPDEVSEWEWWSWDRFVAIAADPEGPLSPWARLQAPLLDSLR